MESSPRAIRYTTHELGGPFGWLHSSQVARTVSQAEGGSDGFIMTCICDHVLPLLFISTNHKLFIHVVIFI